MKIKSQRGSGWPLALLIPAHPEERVPALEASTSDSIQPELFLLCLFLWLPSVYGYPYWVSIYGNDIAFPFEIASSQEKAN